MLLRLPSGGPPGGYDDPIRETLFLLKSEYIRKLDQETLLKSALQGALESLKEESIEVELEPLPDGADREKLLEAFDQRREQLLQSAGDKKDRVSLNYLLLNSMLKSIKDPYCSAMTPEEYARFKETMVGGNFSGIGVYIEQDVENKGAITVVEPIEDGPAEKAGIQAGDIILAIDGKSTEGMETSDAAELIRGEIGTPVMLTIGRAKKELQIEVLRDKIHLRSTGSQMLSEKVGYIEVTMFGDATAEEFDEELEKLEKKGALALIVDLRNNGGGYVTAAVQIASHFLAPGEPLVSVVNGRTGRDDPSLAVSRRPVKLPLALLVNRFSASASEITAGALQDHRRAQVIGETTFGKASVQSVHQFADGGALKYTVAHYLTPNGKDIHRKGIAPDVKIKEQLNRRELEDDPAVKAAIAVLRKKIKS